MGKKRKVFLLIAAVILLAVTVTMLVMFLPRTAAQWGWTEVMDAEIVKLTYTVGAYPHLSVLEIQDRTIIKEMFDYLRTISFQRKYTEESVFGSFNTVTVITDKGRLYISRTENGVCINAGYYAVKAKQLEKQGEIYLRLMNRAFAENDYDPYDPKKDQ